MTERGCQEGSQDREGCCPFLPSHSTQWAATVTCCGQSGKGHQPSPCPVLCVTVDKGGLLMWQD